MAEIPTCLTDEAMEQTMVLGREMDKFALRGMRAKAAHPPAWIEPHPELLAMITAIRANYDRRSRNADFEPRHGG